jgi:hypothetical protein
LLAQDNEHVFAPKGRNIPAQGNALRTSRLTFGALKGRNKRTPTNCRAPSALRGLTDTTQRQPRALPGHWPGLICPRPFGTENRSALCPEGAKHTSPGQRPGKDPFNLRSPERAKQTAARDRCPPIFAPKGPNKAPVLPANPAINPKHIAHRIQPDGGEISRAAHLERTSFDDVSPGLRYSV